MEEKYLDEDYILNNIYTKFPIERPEVISSPFGWRINPITGKREFHEAIDMFSKEGHRNLFAVTAGVVLRGGTDSSGSNFIKIRYNFIDNRTWDGTYHHMKTVSQYQPTDNIPAGAVVGQVGSSGRYVTGVHVHMEVEVGGRKRDPQLWLENLRLIAENRRLLR